MNAPLSSQSFSVEETLQIRRMIVTPGARLKCPRCGGARIFPGSNASVSMNSRSGATVYSVTRWYLGGLNGKASST